MEWTDTATLRREARGPVLRLTLHRPARKNAMSLEMVEDLRASFAAAARRGVRVVVLRGSDGTFCSGGDVADMAAAAAQPIGERDPVADVNRAFGRLLQEVDAAPFAVIAVCEGAVMGGGFGLACVADVTVAVDGVRFRLPETSLGLPPAQIAPFIAARLGRSQARRLAVTGESVDAEEAVRIGLAHLRRPDAAAADAAVAALCATILRGEPAAVAETKRLVNAAQPVELDATLDEAAARFAGFARSERAAAGFAAFLARKAPPWAEEG